MTAATSGRLLALAAAVLFSTGGAALKEGAFTAAQTSGLRSGIAALVLFGWLGRRGIRVSRVTIAAALAYAATVSLFVGSTKLTTAAAAIFLQSAAPLYVVLLGAVLLGERVRARDLPFLLVVGGGLALSFLGRPAASATAPDPAVGNLLGLVSGFTWALTLVSLRYVGRGQAAGAGLSVVALGNLLAALVASPFALPLPAATAGSWATIIYLGVCQIALAYWCLTRAVRHLPALEVSLLLLIEPVLNPIWTWLIHGEEPGIAVIAGGCVIVAATAVRTVVLERPAVAPPVSRSGRLGP